MRPELKARALVALVVSVLAFSMASGLGMMAGFTLNKTNMPDLNFSQPGKLPVIWNQPSNTSTDTQQPITTNTNQEKIYVEPSSDTPQTPVTNQTGGNQTP
ncbi:MAG TPA: hypothetical protein VK444_04835 [Methanobacteriaceae archaeon]|nr:hypothetical protein [Methanobacteriaceae archaeon]